MNGQGGMMRNTPKLKREGFLDGNLRRRIISIYILLLLIITIISSATPVMSADPSESILLAKEAKDAAKDEAKEAKDEAKDTDDDSSVVEGTPAADVIADTPVSYTHLRAHET